MGFFDNPTSKKKKSKSAATKTKTTTTTAKGTNVADLPVATVVPVSEQVPVYPQQPVVQQQQQQYVPPQQQQPAATTTPYTNMNMNNNNRIVLDDKVQRKMNTVIGDRSCAHKTFNLISIITGLTAINNIVGQCIALWFEGNKPMEVLLRIYVIGLCTLAILIEKESIAFIRDSPIVMNWIPRGLFYVFIGVLGVNLYDIGYDNYNRRRYNSSQRYGSYSNNGYSSNNYYNSYHIRVPTSEDCAEWYVWLVAWVMIGVGLLYLLMGILGLRKKLLKERADYQTRHNTIKNHQNGMPV